MLKVIALCVFRVFWGGANGASQGQAQLSWQAQRFLQGQVWVVWQAQRFQSKIEIYRGR